MSTANPQVTPATPKKQVTIQSPAHSAFTTPGRPESGSTLDELDKKIQEAKSQLSALRDKCTSWINALQSIQEMPTPEHGANMQPSVIRVTLEGLQIEDPYIKLLEDEHFTDVEDLADVTENQLVTLGIPL